MRLCVVFIVIGLLSACDPHRQGAKDYDKYCGLCHGYEGEGYLAPQANALANPEFLKSASDEFLMDGIVFGRPGTKMSPWGDSAGGPLTEEQAVGIANYIRTWQREESVSLNEAPLDGDEDAGAVLYKKDCASCHGQDGAGGTALSLNHPEFLRTASNGFLRYAIERGRSGTPMAAYDESYTVADVDHIVAHIRTWEAP